MREVPFVDAHVHLWDLGRLRYPWLTPPFGDDGPNGSVEAIARDYLPADYRIDAASWTVAGYVHVDAGADPADALPETEWLEKLEDGPSGVVAFAPLDDPQVDRMLAAQAARPKVRGIRHIVNWHPDPRRTYTSRDLTRDDGWARGFGLLARYGLSFDLQCYPGQMPAVAGLAGRHPGVNVVVNHAGMAVPTDPEGMEDWRRGMRALAELPHVVTKLSGVGFAYRPWSIEQVRPLILEAIDIFGPERCLFASDFPTDKLFGGFDATLGAYAAIIAGFSEDERRAMWGRNADRVYRLGLGI